MPRTKVPAKRHTTKLDVARLSHEMGVRKPVATAGDVIVRGPERLEICRLPSCQGPKAFDLDALCAGLASVVSTHYRDTPKRDRPIQALPRFRVCAQVLSSEDVTRALEASPSLASRTMQELEETLLYGRQSLSMGVTIAHRLVAGCYGDVLGLAFKSSRLMHERRAMAYRVKNLSGVPITPDRQLVLPLARIEPQLSDSPDALQGCVEEMIGLLQQATPLDGKVSLESVWSHRWQQALRST